MHQLRDFLANIEKYGKDTYIYFDNTKYSYYEILQKSYSLSRFLESCSYRKIYSNLKNSPLSVSLYIASWIADIDIFVPINPRLVDNELVAIIEDDSLFITDKISSLEVNKLYIENPTSFFESLEYTQDYSIYARSLTAHVSSGTTGFYQKHFHDINQIIKYANDRINDLGLKQNDHLLVALSINHAFAFSYQILPALAMGLNITIIREFDARLIAEIINQNNVTALALLPTMYHFLLEQNIHSNNNLCYLSVAGDIVSESLANQVENKLGIPLLNGLGMTEVFGYGQNISANTVNKVKIFADTQVKIVKFENNEYGKIFIKNNMLPLNIQTEWLETGDIGSFDAQSHELSFYGRYKDIIIKGGSNISPIELEAAILKIPNIDDCIVTSKKDKIWGETIWAYLVASEQYSLEFINNKLGNYIAEYKKLDGIIYIDEIPTTTTGKTDRKKLKEMINHE
ncbi:acyl--CoA ligase [Francisella philomiragia]|uniref:AMP-binding enzyme family protein n=1 Tax=Francisella philomiragia TaxID=28110 RepID=A0AAW3DCV8_9GAMM|nr:class I adenylate-forming enzyme family protein [Francisella philomiragia]KFJ43590.1 AMP-binding enzyme family protein [Francisella philomiragia]MBK2255500.1 acyl--CoA ligase [Francisella philomiragia]MBK2273844.1 acyl--CoA ligase [Francisella philomiragia]MBK2277184.1 acyl--CoA ligase [Francisella philomiragia]MBK2281104.1 acyl--CoA ligase [Francisella philomiragia]